MNWKMKKDIHLKFLAKKIRDALNKVALAIGGGEVIGSTAFIWGEDAFNQMEQTALQSAITGQNKRFSLIKYVKLTNRFQIAACSWWGRVYADSSGSRRPALRVAVCQ